MDETTTTATPSLHDDGSLWSLALVYAGLLYSLYVMAKHPLGDSGAHYFVTGVHSAIASAIASALLFWTTAHEHCYACMLALNASFMMADLVLSGVDNLSTVVHHFASALGSWLLLRPENANVRIAALTTIAEWSQVLFCVRQVLRSRFPEAEPEWLNPLFYATHVVLRGPVLFYMIVSEIPDYVFGVPGEDTHKGRWAIVLLCGIPFFVLNQTWNWAIIKKYLPQKPKEDQKAA